MTPQVAWRIAIVVAFVLTLELLCRIGVIDHLTMPPPSEIVRDLGPILTSPPMQRAMLKTLGNVAVAFVFAAVAGIATGAVIHRSRAIRACLDPLFATYYAIPVYAFYPLFIVVFGLGDTPQILIGFMLAVVAVIVNTLNGLDRVSRVLLKTAKIHRLGALRTTLRVSLPCAAPYVLTGLRLAVAYAFIGVIGAEFIMARTGMGFEISFAYNNFDNATMYPLILLVLTISTTVNMTLSHWEKVLRERRGGR